MSSGNPFSIGFRAARANLVPGLLIQGLMVALVLAYYFFPPSRSWFVGILAAGWNAAAAKLGVNLPAWIKRHGTGEGSIEIVISNRGIHITMRNAVKFADNVEGYNRRIQAAVNYQTAATERRLKFMMEKTAREAGLH